MSSFLNLETFNEFLKKQFNGNLTVASKELNIAKSTLCLLKKGERDLGKKTIQSLNEYCKKNNLSINKLLFF